MSVLFFDEEGAADSSICGGKGASLGRLASAANVPAGFVVTVEAYRTWEQAGSEAVPDQLDQEIRAAYSKLQERSGIDDLAVAVSSDRRL